MGPEALWDLSLVTSLPGHTSQASHTAASVVSKLSWLFSLDSVSPLSSGIVQPVFLRGPKACGLKTVAFFAVPSLDLWPLHPFSALGSSVAYSLPLPLSLTLKNEAAKSEGRSILDFRSCESKKRLRPRVSTGPSVFCLFY